MELIKALAQFKTMILSKVISCKIFISNYPLLIDHILREAKFYFQIVQRLQKREEINLERDAYEQETFWNRIMAEHSKFIRGLLDPTDNELISTANNFGNEFDKLTKESKEAMDKTIPISKIATKNITRIYLHRVVLPGTNIYFGQSYVLNKHFDIIIA